MEQLGKYGFLRRDYLKNHRNSTLSGDAFTGYNWRTPSGSGQGSQRMGKGNSEAVRRKRTTAG